MAAEYYGYVAGHRNFVVEGALRAFIVDDGGADHTIQVAVAQWWISDYNSYIFQRPATMFVTPVVDVQQLPQYAIASYLGMTTEFLSKIRNNKVKRKG